MKLVFAFVLRHHQLLPLVYIHLLKTALFIFQVIGDRIGIPSALVRGEFNRAWNEVTLPTEYEVCDYFTFLLSKYSFVKVGLTTELLQAPHLHCATLTTLAG